MGQHSVIGASSCERWWNCPGSVALLKKIEPKPTSIYAAEGTVAHELIEKCFPNTELLFEHVGQVVQKEEHYIPITIEMANACRFYIDTIKTDAYKYKVDINDILVEERLQLSELHPAAFGTCDTYFVSSRGLHVYDFKYGQGVTVSADRNKQMLYYAVGVYLGAKSLLSNDAEVHTTIIQPRGQGDKVRRDAYSLYFLVHWANELREKMKATEAVGAHLETGSHCRWCEAKPICSAWKTKINELAREDFDYQTYEPEQLSEILSYSEFIENWIKGIKDFCYEQVLGGQKIPGKKLVRGRTSRKWTDEEQAASILSLLLDEEELYTKKILTTAQAEKKIPEVDKNVLASVITTTEGKLALVDSDDKRPEVNVGIPSARDQFDSINE